MTEARSIPLRDGRQATVGYASECDAAAIVTYVEAIAGESDFLTFGLGDFGMTVEQEVEFLKSLADRSKGMMLKASVGDEVVGFAMLTRAVRPRVRHVADLGLSVRKAFWGSGIGAALCTTIFAEGKRQRLGFAHEGRLAGAFLVNGIEFDELVMGLRL